MSDILNSHLPLSVWPQGYLHGPLHGSFLNSQTYPRTIPHKKDELKKNQFYFRRRREKINWRLLGNLDVEKIIRELDIASLQNSLENVTFCDIEAEDLRSTDPNLIKLFRLAQLMIEYLLYSQDWMENQQQLNEVKMSTQNEKWQSLIEENRHHNDEISTIKKENRQLKKTIYAYQLWSKIPGGMGSNGQPIPTADYHRCRYCSKVFNAKVYLEGHLLRRHPDLPFYMKQEEGKENIAIEKKKMESDVLEKMNHKLEAMAMKLLDQEKIWKEATEKKMANELKQQHQLLEETRKFESQKYEKELQDLKIQLNRQMMDERETLMKEKIALDTLRQSLNVTSQNNVAATASLPVPNGDQVMQEMRLFLQNEMNHLKENLLLQESQQIQRQSGDWQKMETFVAQTAAKMEEFQSTLIKQSNEIPKKVKEAKIETAPQEKIINSPPPSLSNVETEERSPKIGLKQKDFQIEKIKETIKEKDEDPEDMNEPDWHECRSMMESFKAKPLHGKPYIISHYVHPLKDAVDMRQELEDVMNLEFEQYNLNSDNLMNETKVSKIKKVLQKQRQHQDHQDYNNPLMRAYIEHELADAAKRYFRFNFVGPIKPTLTMRTEFVPTLNQRNSRASFASAGRRHSNVSSHLSPTASALQSPILSRNSSSNAMHSPTLSRNISINTNQSPILSRNPSMNTMQSPILSRNVSSNAIPFAMSSSKRTQRPSSPLKVVTNSRQSSFIPKNTSIKTRHSPLIKNPSSASVDWNESHEDSESDGEQNLNELDSQSIISHEISENESDIVSPRKRSLSRATKRFKAAISDLFQKKSRKSSLSRPQSPINTHRQGPVVPPKGVSREEAKSMIKKIQADNQTFSNASQQSTKSNEKKSKESDSEFELSDISENEDDHEDHKETSIIKHNPQDTDKLITSVTPTDLSNVDRGRQMLPKITTSSTLPKTMTSSLSKPIMVAVKSAPAKTESDSNIIHSSSNSHHAILDKLLEEMESDDDAEEDEDENEEDDHSRSEEMGQSKNSKIVPSFVVRPPSTSSPEMDRNKGDHEVDLDEIEELLERS